MAAEDRDREDRPDDSGDIDARFEEIVAGLRAEQAASQQRRREAIRRAQSQRRPPGGATPNRPLEGFDNPNPWPPRPRPVPDPEASGAEASGAEASGDKAPGHGAGQSAGPSAEAPDTEALETGAPAAPARPGDDGPGLPPAPPADPQRSAPGRHRAPFGGAEESDYPESAPGSWRGWEEQDEEEHFIPPTPPLPAGDLHLWAIVVGLLGGPLVLILSNAFSLLRGSWWTPLGIGLSVAGVVLLILRLPKNRDFTDSSGGAQV